MVCLYSNIIKYVLGVIKAIGLSEGCAPQQIYSQSKVFLLIHFVFHSVQTLSSNFIVSSGITTGTTFGSGTAANFADFFYEFVPVVTIRSYYVDDRSKIFENRWLIYRNKSETSHHLCDFHLKCLFLFFCPSFTDRKGQKKSQIYIS